MKYSVAKVMLAQLAAFRETLKYIDIEKADIRRNGQYTIALEQLDAVLDNRMELEEIRHPDNILRNIMLLAHLDAVDFRTTKSPKK